MGSSSVCLEGGDWTLRSLDLTLSPGGNGTNAVQPTGVMEGRLWWSLRFSGHPLRSYFSLFFFF